MKPYRIIPENPQRAERLGVAYRIAEAENRSAMRLLWSVTAIGWTLVLIAALASCSGPGGAALPALNAPPPTPAPSCIPYTYVANGVVMTGCAQ